MNSPALNQEGSDVSVSETEAMWNKIDKLHDADVALADRIAKQEGRTGVFEERLTHFGGKLDDFGGKIDDVKKDINNKHEAIIGQITGVHDVLKVLADERQQGIGKKKLILGVVAGVGFVSTVLGLFAYFG